MKLKKTEKETPENSCPQKPRRSMIFNLRILTIIWGAVLLLVVTAFIVSQFGFPGFVPWDATFPLMSIIIAFAAFVIQSIFSFSILNYNADLRRMNEEIRKGSEDVNKRAEAFRNLQYISSNYTIIDFIDYMLMYAEPKRYKDKLKSAKDFTFYLKEDNVDICDVLENFDDYSFITIKLPFSIIEGKTVGKILFSRFKFVTESREHRFVPCGRFTSDFHEAERRSASRPAQALILYNETDRRSEAVVNLIMKKSGDFYKPGTVNPFLKIKISLTMHSLLGVSVTGWVELYFTNPLKIEESGANKYKINSSQFEVSGLPVLLNSVNEDVKKI